MEENEKIDDRLIKNRKKRINNFGSVMISTTISIDLHRKCYDGERLTISWSEALRRGVTSILSERQENYINPLQLERKIAEQKERYMDLMQDFIKAQEELQKFRGVQK